jgi:hypothetical protein
MKKILLLLAVTAMFAACNNEKKTDAPTTDAKPDKPTAPLAYTAAYSSSFEMGNPAYAAMIVQGSWKDWEMNTMDNMKSWAADTITAYSADNKVAHSLDTLQARWKKGRADYTTVIDTIDAVMPVYSTDKKENWVLVWATEINVNSKGKRDTVSVMETWRINKDGKADLVYQFDRHARKE